MPPIDLRSVNITHKNAKIQYTYPETNVGTTYKPQYSMSDKNFTFADDGIFFSGYCTDISIVKPTHNIQNGVSSVQDADLVLTHTRTTNGIGVFYVIIPLIYDTTTAIGTQNEKTEVKRMMDGDKVFTLNNDLKKIKPNITCYIDNASSNYVFVFDKPILVADNFNGIPSSSVNFSGIKYYTSGKGKKKKTTSSAFIVKNNQNIEDEIECEYVTQTDETATSVDKKNVMKFLSWGFILLGMTLCMVYALTLVSTKLEPDAASTIFMVIGGIGIVFLVFYLRLFSRTSSKKIQHGSMTMFSIIVILLSLMGYNGMLKKPAVVAV
jgi:hypothetical protein